MYYITLFCIFIILWIRVAGEAISAAYNAPAVTPWRYIAATRNQPYHNPGIRLIEYDTDSLSIVDYTQYYFDLHTANEGKSII